MCGSLYLFLCDGTPVTRILIRKIVARILIRKMVVIPVHGLQLSRCAR